MTPPARFWPRCAAWSLDMALLALACSPFLAGPVARGGARLRTSLFDLLTGAYRDMHHALSGGESPLLFLGGLSRAPWLRQGIADLQLGLWQAMGAPLLAFVLVAIVFQAAAEASPWQGGPGKRLLGLRAVEADGRRLSPARALSRQLAGILSWLTLNVGHAMAAVPPGYRALHDRASHTRVVGGATALPGWARAWLGLLAIGALAATVALLVAVLRIADAALLAALG